MLERSSVAGVDTSPTLLFPSLSFYPTAAMLPTALLALGLAAVSPAAAADSLGGSIVEAGDTLVSAMMVRRACRLPRRSECLYWDAS